MKLFSAFMMVYELFKAIISVCVSRFNRDWRYHKEERVWITRAPGMEPTLKTNAYERGTYYFFDCLNWRKVAKVNEHTHTLNQHQDVLPTFDQVDSSQILIS